MATEIYGNIRGLAASELRALRKLAQRRVAPEEVVSLELAREIWRLASDLRRRVGVLLSREGMVERVFVGTKEILYLPDIGRYRLGRGRLRRLRLVFSDLSKSNQAELPSDILADLEKLRLDSVVSLKNLANHTEAAFAHIIPARQAGERAISVETIADVGRWDLDFGQFIAELEDELARSEENSVATSSIRAMIVGVYDSRVKDSVSSLDEVEELAKTAGVTVVDRVIQRRPPDPKTVLGKGKLEEVVLRCLRLGVELIIFDCELRPAQWRAITNSTELKVIDRSMLILDIFAQRAQSSEGRLQVELAQLRYNLPRLVEKDAGLSRLTGGIGGRGPGETKLEIGRRRTRDRITDLEKKIDRISSERHLRRARRQQSAIPVVAILGYTNVGKSTLFNLLSGSSVVAENKLFATLDPAQRRIVMPARTVEESPFSFILSDTVGFIRRLPDELRNAFRATLEELRQASLLLHVIDASDPEIHERKRAVHAILEELGLLDIPMIMVLNKIDLVDENRCEALVREHEAVAVSALKNKGINELLQEIKSRLQQLIQKDHSTSRGLDGGGQDLSHNAATDPESYN